MATKSVKRKKTWRSLKKASAQFHLPPTDDSAPSQLQLDEVTSRSLPPRRPPRNSSGAATRSLPPRRPPRNSNGAAKRSIPQPPQPKYTNGAASN